MLPTAKAGGFSVLRRSQRHASLKALPKPLYVLGGVVISMEACSALRTDMPANGESLVDQLATSATPL